MSPTKEELKTASETVFNLLLHVERLEVENLPKQLFANYPGKDAWLVRFVECLDRAKKGTNSRGTRIEAGYSNQMHT